MPSEIMLNCLLLSQVCGLVEVNLKIRSKSTNQALPLNQGCSPKCASFFPEKSHHVHHVLPRTYRNLTPFLGALPTEVIN